MPITFNWDNTEHTVMFINFADHWSWDECDQVITELFATIEATPYTVDCIFAVNNVALPSGNAVPHLIHYTKLRPKNFGISVAVNVSAFGMKITELLFKVFPRTKITLVFALSLDDAHRIIAARKAERGDKLGALPSSAEVGQDRHHPGLPS